MLKISLHKVICLQCGHTNLRFLASRGEKVWLSGAAAGRDTAPKAKNMQIYLSSSSSSGRQVTPFWRERYERDAGKYWDLFYRRHKDKFFKDRHYLKKEWGRYFEERENLVVMEAGCGVGNTIFPLVSTYPNIYIHACDFSPRAIELVKAHDDFRDDQINAFVCDLLSEDFNDLIPSSSVDIVTMVFMLSAVAPEKMSFVLRNIRKVLKPTGYVLLRDYASGDLAQERLAEKEQKISENFYVRGDGTRAYYFTEDFLANLFIESGFGVKCISICKRQIQNRSKDLVMKRCWIQAVFCLNSCNTEEVDNGHVQMEHRFAACSSEHDTEVDASDSMIGMFDCGTSYDEVIVFKPRGYSFQIRSLGREYQHTCKSTGLMLWESARLMCNVIAENPLIVAGKSMLELGCGSAGICSMISVQFAKYVVSTDGDDETLKLLRENIFANLEHPLLKKLVVQRLVWGKKEDLDAIKDLCYYKGGFEVILGTDVCYNYEAILPLFTTAKELMLKETLGKSKPALLLCHIERRVHEDAILSTAAHLGFRLKDKWINGVCLSDGVINSWFSSDASYWNSFQNIPLSILYFEL
ncbi:hypothetical protein HPP92_005010 [Vanilla planifolia]|uniref:Methyltransferase type 12 domain-containing protein n=1 Tax=Vanilla planifolia TaxID=51239 RepID=A0A835RTI8_VANPL|nr:hypothetical protein HPP92_005010 [Vanilla planifolia]